MEYEFITSHNGELYHWGTKGMKWGIRRYQNKDGSLTPAGKKRRAKLESELKTLNGKKTTAKSPAKSTSKTASKSSAKPTEEAPKKKTVVEMTDDELRNMTNRMQLESNYYNAARNLAVANPRQVSKGEKFMNKLVNDVIAPAAVNAGKSWAEKTMKDVLGLNKKEAKSEYQKAKEEFDYWNNKNQADKNKKEYEKRQRGESDDGSDLDKLLEAYRKTTKEERDELREAAQWQENIKKLNNKKKD